MRSVVYGVDYLLDLQENRPMNRDLDEDEFHMLAAALNLLLDHCEPQIADGRREPFATWKRVGLAMQSQLGVGGYVARCPFCKTRIRKPPTVCEGCGVSFSFAEKYDYPESVPDGRNEGEAKLNLYHQWRKRLAQD
jgi:hypothetical protein